MLRIGPLFVVLVLLSSPYAPAADFLIRLEKVRITPASASRPAERLVLHSVETIAQRGRRFHCRAKLGQETVEFRGELKPFKDTYSVPVEYLHTWPCDVRDAKVREPYKTGIKNSAWVSLGIPAAIGEQTKSQTINGVELSETIRWQVTVVKCEE